MSVLPLPTTMSCKWESITSPQLGSYKMDRPAYSTPPPVENIPSNNECKMVELRGSEVASFSLGCEEYICLPQAFDLFLKHLVGGLHTVYTKLKRLSITPVVCNVEQVRILRGLGAIQPGVNRCKLITRKDFEILYQDCTTASRPGRPPKRYPVLPPTADLMSHHANMRSNNKRMRMDQPNHERRTSGSPPKENEKNHIGLPSMPSDLQNTSSANLAYLQAIRQHYQQAAASGIPNALDSQQLNPALAPFMMSYPALFSSGIPPNSMAMLNHFSQMTQNHAASAAAVAHLAVNGGKLNAQMEQNSNQEDCRSPNIDKDSDGEEMHRPRSYGNVVGLSNGIGSDGRTSPTSSLGSFNDTSTGTVADGNGHPHGFRHQFKESPVTKTPSDISESVRKLTKSPNCGSVSDEEPKANDGSGGSISSMQSLLTNIQGLLKVAADNASLQEKHSSIEIADLRIKLNQERQIRELTEQKLNDCEKEKADTEKQLHLERNENKKLQSRLLAMQHILGSHDINNNGNGNGDAEVSSRQIAPSPSNRVPSSDGPSNASSPLATASSPPAPSFETNLTSARMTVMTSQQSSVNKSSLSASPESLTPPSTEPNLNNNNNNSSDDQKSPDYRKHPMVADSRVAEIPLDLGRPRTEHAALQEQQRLFFKSSLLFQPAASQ